MYTLHTIRRNARKSLNESLPAENTATLGPYSKMIAQTGE
jgi:hypothetical protein